MKTAMACAVLAASTAITLAPAAHADPGPVYANCTEAHNAGRSDIPQGDEAYWPDGDRDGDGIACESTAN